VGTQRPLSVLLDITVVNNVSRTDEIDREVEGEYFACPPYDGPVFGCCESVSVITSIRYFPTMFSSEFLNDGQRNKICRTEYVIMKITEKLPIEGITFNEIPNLIHSKN
jgi:hypothetical protein